MLERDRIFVYAYVALGIVLLAGYVILGLRSDGDSRETASIEAIKELKDRADLNVIFILIDTLRAERLGAYGYSRDTSQNIDRLAASGIRFANHLAQSSWTKASMASLWTGLYPVRTGVLRYPHALTEDARVPAEIMQDAGFRTAALWRNGWVAPNFGFSQGFDTYQRPRPRTVDPGVRQENPWISLEGSDTDVIRSAREFFRTHSKERFFLYLHLMDVHQYLYDAESALFGTRYTDAYDNAIHTLDRLLGILLDDLEARDLRDRTMIVLASDHGEAFGEHGREGHAHDVYSETTHVPFIIALPYQIDQEIVVNTTSANVDVWPTLLDILGLPGLDDPDGRSLLGEILKAGAGQGEEAEETIVFAQIDQTWGRTDRDPKDVIALTQGTWRYVHHASDPDRDELYDLASDPREQRNIVGRSADQPETFKRHVEEYLESPDPPWGSETPTVELDDLQLNQLRALGYAID